MKTIFYIYSSQSFKYREIKEVRTSKGQGVGTRKVSTVALPFIVVSVPVRGSSLVCLSHGIVCGLMTNSLVLGLLPFKGASRRMMIFRMSSLISSGRVRVESSDVADVINRGHHWQLARSLPKWSASTSRFPFIHLLSSSAMPTSTQLN